MFLQTVVFSSWNWKKKCQNQWVSSSTCLASSSSDLHKGKMISPLQLRSPINERCLSLSKISLSFRFADICNLGNECKLYGQTYFKTFLMSLGWSIFPFVKEDVNRLLGDKNIKFFDMCFCTNLHHVSSLTTFFLEKYWLNDNLLSYV